MSVKFRFEKCKAIAEKTAKNLRGLLFSRTLYMPYTNADFQYQR